MMNTLKKIFFSCALAALVGCTTAGPYVTNISSDGAYGLNIEKCKVELNAFLGVVNTGECSNTSYPA